MCVYIHIYMYVQQRSVEVRSVTNNDSSFT